MNFDIRMPIGSMFAILGALLVGYGLISDAKIYERSFDINVNLIWGAVLLLFGGIMLLLGRRAIRRSAAASAPAETPPRAAPAVAAPHVQ
jgi:hypothetical protein